MKCILCNSATKPYFKTKTKKYFKCENCQAISMDFKNFPTKEYEIKRYSEHNNDVNDVRYQNNVSPIDNEVLKDFTPKNNGLDFGCGTGPVITKLLRDKDYPITTYDPFFHNNLEALNKSYSFIVCCEVIEHFHNPLKEFKLLKSLLKPNGKLYCMTDLFSETINFKTWYYKDDHTHVIFYHKNTIRWLKEFLGFSKATVNNRLIIFEV